MNGPEILRIVDAMHRDKGIPKDMIFEGIEQGMHLAARKHYGIIDQEFDDIVVSIDRTTGIMTATKAGIEIDPVVLGRIAAQVAKQVFIQKIREAESNVVFRDYGERKGELVIGTVQRIEGGSAILSLGKSEAFLPRSEMIPGETPHVGQRIKAVILEVRKMGNRVRIVLSRTHPDFVRRLFEQEIPEIADRTIQIRAIAREAGYRTKIAASSIDSKVDAVGACVGVRGSRIKNIVDELGGERIDIVRWNDSLQVMIPNALQPANITEVFLYTKLGRAIVMVPEDQLSLAIGRRGQNVRLASKLVGWDMEIMTEDELSESIEKAEGYFKMIPGVTDDMVEVLISEGFLSYDDLTFQETADLAEMLGVTEEEAMNIINFAEEAAEALENLDDDDKDSEANERSQPTEENAVPDKPAEEVMSETTSETDGHTDKPSEESDNSSSNSVTDETHEAEQTREPAPVELATEAQPDTTKPPEEQPLNS
ncbi:MAG TPA: transcription termination factor NusA [Gemmatales bacterium]|nr:transcription termination factor NusA [Gemmatales bacterium]